MGGWTTDTSYLFGKPEGMSQGPDLPLALEGACALAINNSQTSLVGGHDGDSYSRAAFIYDWTNSEWTEVSSMDQPRRLYTGGCGSFTDPASGDIKMVVIGGQGNNGTTTEIYNLANDAMNGVMDLIIPLEECMMCLQSKTNKGVSMYDSGSVDAIYRFDADTYEFVELDQRLTLNGHGVPGLMVPRDSLGVSFV